MRETNQIIPDDYIDAFGKGNFVAVGGGARVGRIMTIVQPWDQYAE